MNSFVIYLLKASIGVMLISFPYYLLLRKDTNLNFKRFFLLSGLILAFVLPYLKLSLPTKVILDIPSFFLNIDSPSLADNIEPTQASLSNSIMQLKYLIPGIYIIGIFILFFRSFISMISWLRLRRDSDSDQSGIYYSDRNEVFSLFRTIHLPKYLLDSEEHSSILIHEQAHIRQMHFIDLLIGEIAILLTWFNPFTWLITRMIKENHEHLADREVLSQGVDFARYRAYLLNQTLGVPVFRLVHSINHSLTKNRFDMMKNIFNLKNSGLVKTMLLIPAILLSLGFLNVSKAQDGKIQGTVKFSDSNSPATGTSIIIKSTTMGAGTTIGTVADRNGNFEILVTERADLIFSYVGYKTVILNCKPGHINNVVLEPRVVNLNIKEKKIEKAHKSKSIINGGEGAQPVYFINGKRVESISEIDSDDIERVTVIKDEAVIKENYPNVDPSRGVIDVKSKNQQDEESKQVFYIVEDMPKFQDGKESIREYIYSNLEYPSKATEQKIEGKVVVQFIVNEKGEVESVKVVHSSNKIFDKAAQQVIEEMPDWSPGTQRGKAVKVMFTIQVAFNASGSDS